jgi:hypothetical protein
MIRDLEKLRGIMLHLEGNLTPGSEISSTDLPFTDGTDEDYSILDEHIKLLLEDNLIEARAISIRGVTLYYIFRITSSGHEFISAFKEDTIWNAVKEKATKVGGFTIPILVELGKETIKNQLGLK